jgi:hypothetical protein
MHFRGAWQRRGFAIAMLALTLTVVAPELSAPVGAAPARAALSAHRRGAVSPATRKARILAAMKARAAAIAKYKAAAGASGATGTKPKPKLGPFAAAAKRKRALALKRLAVQKAAAKRRNAAAVAALRAAKNKKKKASSLSLPLLAFLAIAPFVLMGLYLLGADYLRRREPRKRGGASLVITRVSDR